MPTELRKLRKKARLSQVEAAKLLGVSLRSYQTYENDSNLIGSIKYNYFYNFLSELSKIDEEHGILSIEEIKNSCNSVFSDYDIEFCILFGSYSKGIANEKSDIDLLISSSVTGLRFFGLTEKLREVLHKKVDLLNIEQLVNNPELLHDVLKDGIKIYG